MNPEKGRQGQKKPLPPRWFRPDPGLALLSQSLRPTPAPPSLWPPAPQAPDAGTLGPPEKVGSGGSDGRAGDNPEHPATLPWDTAASRQATQEWTAPLVSCPSHVTDREPLAHVWHRPDSTNGTGGFRGLPGRGEQVSGREQPGEQKGPAPQAPRPPDPCHPRRQTGCAPSRQLAPSGLSSAGRGSGRCLLSVSFPRQRNA